jgi:hypothetical protein
MRVSVGALCSGEAGSGTEGRVAASDPSWMVRQGPEPLATWQHWSPPRRRGGVRSLGHVAALESSLSREVGSSDAVACGSAWTHTLPFVLS